MDGVTRSSIRAPGMPAQKIVDDHPPGRVHRLFSNPVAARLMWPESLRGQPVGIQAAGPHAIQPIGLDHMHPVRGALPQEPLTVLRRGSRPRPDAPAWAIPREPEHRRVAGIDKAERDRAERGIVPASAVPYR